MAEFEKLGVASFLAQNCSNLGITLPTKIQEKAVPLIFNGKNLLGQAKTGSGKTAAFALPILQRLSEDPYGVFALVVTPTRELAQQIADQFRVFGVGTNLNDLVVSGGRDLIKERLALSEKPHVVIATPGRLAEHLKNGIENWFSRIKFLVLDEADRLLSDCFRGDLKVVLAALPPPSKRQTLLFTATLDAKTAHIAESKKDKIELIETSDESPQAVVAELETFFVLAPRAVKECYLFSVLTRSHLKQSVIVFVARKKVCELLTETLIQLEVEAVSLNSDLSQVLNLICCFSFRKMDMLII
ncbi:putative ATP-dependent RNA helicase ddx49, variant 4 [Bonamia ostreae]|uniref:ATP-dependent RNA helicase ddx49, variant 4 n=1 Tax=Bonamia ostreae TaxID=126728 RepID=A0ABV2ANR4_9EUKA